MRCVITCWRLTAVDLGRRCSALKRDTKGDAADAPPALEETRERNSWLRNATRAMEAIFGQTEREKEGSFGRKSFSAV